MSFMSALSNSWATDPYCDVLNEVNDDPSALLDGSASFGSTETFPLLTVLLSSSCFSRIRPSSRSRSLSSCFFSDRLVVWW